MLTNIEFNLGISICSLIAAIFILILTIFEFIAYIECNKFLIFKKEKIINFGWIINIIVLIITTSITILLFILNLSQPKYLSCVIVWFITLLTSLTFLICRTILIIKSKKNKYEIKKILSFNTKELANKFKIDNFNEYMCNVKNPEKDKWYKNLKQDFNSLSNKISNASVNNITPIISEIITFEELYCATAFSKRNKYAFCLFLTLLDYIQKKLKM